MPVGIFVVVRMISNLPHPCMPPSQPARRPRPSAGVLPGSDGSCRASPRPAPGSPARPAWGPGAPHGRGPAGADAAVGVVRRRQRSSSITTTRPGRRTDFSRASSPASYCSGVVSPQDVVAADLQHDQPLGRSQIPRLPQGRGDVGSHLRVVPDLDAVAVGQESGPGDLLIPQEPGP